MNIRQQMRTSGLLIILFSLSVSSMKVVAAVGEQNAMTQWVYGIGYTGLIFICTMIHLVQARRSGIFGLLAYLISLLSLAYANVASFLILAKLSGIKEIHETYLAVWNPVVQTAGYGAYAGFLLLGISIAWSGVFPKRAGRLIALGAGLQLPAQNVMGTASPLHLLFTVSGSVLFAAGLVWIGWTLVSGQGVDRQEPGLSGLDHKWGGPFLVFTGLLLPVDAFVNMIGGLSLASGITHLISYTALLVLPFLLFANYGEKASWRGFLGMLSTQLGAALYLITAYLILAQLAGVIDSNRALNASWVDIPVGRWGEYMSVAGMFLLGWETIHAGVFPPGSGWLVVSGIALALPFVFTIQAYYLGILWVLGAILEGSGVVWMGLSLIKKNARREKAPLAEGLR